MLKNYSGVDMLYDYLISNCSTELMFNLMQLVLYRTSYEIDFRQTVTDLLNIGTSYRAVFEFEQLHDKYYESVRDLQ